MVRMLLPVVLLVALSAVAPGFSDSLSVDPCKLRTQIQDLISEKETVDEEEKDKLLLEVLCELMTSSDEDSDESDESKSSMESDESDEDSRQIRKRRSTSTVLLDKCVSGDGVDHECLSSMIQRAEDDPEPCETSEYEEIFQNCAAVSP